MSTREALSIAMEAGLDLVEVSPMEKPPVCRIMDYGKHKYEQKKRLKTASASHQVAVKEIRLRPKTDPHDRELKLKHAQQFLGDGHKVQFTMLFRGRERFNRDFARNIFKDIVEILGDKIKVEREPMMENRRMTLLVSPSKSTGKKH